MTRILVVEDDANSSVMLTAALEASGYEVTQASDGVEALDKLRRSLPDLVISDILMPRLDGYSLCRQVKDDSRTAQVPFIFYTATYTERADEALAYALGAARFVVKPAEIDELLRIIDETLQETPAEAQAEGSAVEGSAALEVRHVARLNAKLNKKIAELSSERRALQLSEARFRDFAETAADWFWETDERLRIVYATRYRDRLDGSVLNEFLEQGKATPAEGQEASIVRLLAERQAFRDSIVELPEVGGGRSIFRANGRPVTDEGGRFVGYRGVCRDATEAVELERKMSHDATHDALTGLLNRREFNDRLGNAFENNRRYGTPSQVCFMDLDQFKFVNDTAGHVAGDAMLSGIANLLAGCVRNRDTLARLGGDEFGLILENCPLRKAIEICDEMVEKVRDYRFVWDGQAFSAGISIGIVNVGDAASTHIELLSRADVACYAAKDGGRNRVAVYDPSGTGDAHHGEMLRAVELSQALEQQRLYLEAQPIVPLHSEAGPIHFELLVRLRADDGSLIYPGAFIPAAERYGRMSMLDRWVVQAVLTEGLATFAAIPRAVLSINLSGQSFADRSFLEFLTAEIRNSAIDPGRVCFEITETTAISNLDAAASSIARIRDLGCEFALDDFGSGACSFTYLKKLPVDLVKVDGSFVRDVCSDPVDHAMVSSITAIASVMGIRSVGEMVENSETLKMLQSIGVDYAQGYGVARPGALAQVCNDYRDFDGT